MQARIHRLLQERSEMVGAIAHDLRTPLARLAFRLDALPANVRDKASADIEEMSQMIEATLEFIRDQNRPSVREPLDLRLLVESVTDNLRDTGHDAVLEPGPPAPMRGDPVSLRRMVANLVDNALKYGQRARLRLLSADADGYRLDVDDDGPGIDPASVEQLFMPFVRGEASRNRRTGGIGLGLASVRSIAQAHGGHVHLNNRSEGGLRASVVLPAHLH
jgi:two-component system OmpR family sensor kinase